MISSQVLRVKVIVKFSFVEPFINISLFLQVSPWKRWQQAPGIRKANRHQDHHPQARGQQRQHHHQWQQGGNRQGSS